MASEPARQPTVAKAAELCLNAFQQCMQLSASAFPREISLVEDQFARFSLWAANIGVFTPGRASLDHRLREAQEVHEVVVGVLESLEDQIKGCSSYFKSHERTQPDNAQGPTDEKTDSSIRGIGNQISLLHRLSNIIRKASTDAQNVKAASSFKILDEEGYDVEPWLRVIFAKYIHDKFCKIDENILHRLVSTMIVRWKRVLYRRSRFGSTSVKGSLTNPQPRVKVPALQLQQTASRQESPQHPDNTEVTPKVNTKIASKSQTGFSATTLRLDNFKKASAPSTVSATKTISLGSHEELPFPDAPLGRVRKKYRKMKKAREEEYRLYIDSLSRKAESQLPTSSAASMDQAEASFKKDIDGYWDECIRVVGEVTCPFCFYAIPTLEVNDDAKWKTHVKNDLDAYVCLFKECDTPDQLYSHSEDWLKHMREHALRWRCKSNSHGPLAFDTRDKYTEHMKEAHKKVFSNTELHILADRNARTIRPLFETCPLCGLNDIAKGANIEEHITGHLRFLALKSLPTFQDEVSQSSDAESVSSQVSKPHKRSTIENDPDKHANLTFDDNEENRIVEQCSEIDSSSLSPYKQYSEPRNYVSVAGSLPGRGDSQLIEKSRAFVETALLISSTEGRQFEWGFVIKDLEASMNIKDDPILQNLALRQLPLYAPKVNPKQRGIDTDSIGQRYTPVDDGTEDEGAAVSASKTDHQGPIPVSNSYSVNPSEADNDTNPAVLGDGQNSDIPQDTEHSHERIHEQTRSGSESRERRVGAPSSSPIPLPVEVNARPRSPTLSSNLKQSHGDILDLQQRSEVDHISNVPVSDSVSLEISPQTQTYNSILIKSDVLGNLNGPQFKNADTLENIDLDDMISRLLKSARFSSKKLCLSHEEIRSICMASREIFLSQPVLLELAAPLKIVGDIHGQYTDLIRIFQLSGFPPTVNYLFLGDYVDRGKRSLETILLLLCYKLKYPENFFLLRGNHECANVTRVYGFYDECKRRCDVRIWKTFIDIFNCLPVASIVADKIFCVHGGLSPSLLDAKEIRQLNRPTDVPDYGLLSDLLWSDPADMEKGWEPNERGVSYCFGKSEIKNFLSFNDFDLICRAHMVVEDGYEFFEDRLLVTLFSAPNYCGEFDNWGGIMSVSDDLLCSFELLKPLGLETSSATKEKKIERLKNLF